MITHRIQLPKLLKELNLPLKAVEIGVAEGLFSRDLLQEGIELLYSVDAWTTLDQVGDAASSGDWHNTNYENAVKLLKPFGQKSIILQGLSNEMAQDIPDNSLGLVYIDCDHSYEGVKADIENYYPKLVEGAIMAFHDYMMPQYGVKRAVTEFAAHNNLLIYILPENAVKDAGAYIVKPLMP